MRFLTNMVKQKLKRDETTIGSWITLPSIEVTEILSRNNFDFLVIDIEHNTMTLETVQKMIMVIEGYGVMPFIRVPSVDPDLFKKVLDMGCYGIIVPDIKSRDDLDRAFQYCYYKPKGNRGVGLSRAQGYGVDFKKYKSWFSDNFVLIAQIESCESVDLLYEIYQYPNLDASIIGPYDLTASLNASGDLNDPTVIKYVNKYKSISKKMKVPCGYHIVSPSVLELKNKISEKYRFIVYGVDETFLSETIKFHIDQMGDL